MAYSKYKDPWSVTDLLSGKAFNHLETQWDEIKADADVHDHDTRYYTRTLGDTVFFSASFFAGFDADLLDGSHYDGIVSQSLPLGSILIWSGAAGAIPTHWHLCDGGEYGGLTSPDLRDRFVIGAGATYDPGDTAGPVAYNTQITPTATITVGAHTLTTTELPAHTHTWVQYYQANYIYKDKTGNVSVPSSNATRNASIGEQASGGGSHGHTGSTIVFDPIESRPPYYALCYIMKYE